MSDSAPSALTSRGGDLRSTPLRLARPAWAARWQRWVSPRTEDAIEVRVRRILATRTPLSDEAEFMDFLVARAEHLAQADVPPAQDGRRSPPPRAEHR